MISINFIVISTVCLYLSSVDAVYYSWRLGNQQDYKLPDESVLDGGIVLAGGSTDQDEAMVWLLNKARGGDALIFRIAGSTATVADYPNADAYNPYFYSELGVKLNSVETIFLNKASVANEPEVVEKTRNAEAIFFTGGDQANYWLHIKNTPLETALNYAINVKRVAVGGTSAGCAIQGEYLFSAENDTIQSTAALSDPYDYRMVIRDNLFRHQYLKNTITDTHYNNPDRRGRHIAFMARVLVDNKDKVDLVKGIGVEEKTAVCIDHDGKAYVFSSVSNSAHFISQFRQNEYPEECLPRTKLDWYKNRQALEAYKVAGSKKGDRYFDLKTWRTGNGGTWAFYYSNRGVFGTA